MYMYDVCTHSSLPTSAILALGLLKKKEEEEGEESAWAAIWHFRFSGTSQVYFGSFYQHGYYCRECLYGQISLKVSDSETILAFSSRLPLRRHHIAWLGTFSVDPNILVSLYASAHHPHATLATGIFMPQWAEPQRHTVVVVCVRTCMCVCVCVCVCVCNSVPLISWWALKTKH